MVFQEQNKFHLGGVQKQIQENSIIPENLWCTSYINYHRSSLDSLFVLFYVSVGLRNSYNTWNYYCSKPKKSGREFTTEKDGVLL